MSSLECPLAKTAGRVWSMLMVLSGHQAVEAIINTFEYSLLFSGSMQLYMSFAKMKAESDA